jgi:type II secretory pathway component HofQ
MSVPDREEDAEARRVPLRRAEDAIAAAERNGELQRQLEQSLEAERQGDMGTPLKELQARRRADHTAEHA